MTQVNTLKTNADSQILLHQYQPPFEDFPGKYKYTKIEMKVNADLNLFLINLDLFLLHSGLRWNVRLMKW